MDKFIEKAIDLGMIEVDYKSDGIFYVASFYIHENGKYEKTHPRNESSVTIEFKKDLSYAQIFWENRFLFEEITIEKCLQLVNSFNIISEAFKSLENQF